MHLQISQAPKIYVHPLQQVQARQEQVLVKAECWQPSASRAGGCQARHPSHTHALTCRLPAAQAAARSAVRLCAARRPERAASSQLSSSLSSPLSSSESSPLSSCSNQQGRAQQSSVRLQQHQNAHQQAQHASRVTAASVPPPIRQYSSPLRKLPPTLQMHPSSPTLQVNPAGDLCRPDVTNVHTAQSPSLASRASRRRNVSTSVQPGTCLSKAK